MLSFSQAFSRPYMANMQSTQRSGDAEGMTHAALTKSVTTHGDGGEHGEHGGHGGGHEEGHNDFSNAAKASLALSSQGNKESKEKAEEKDGKKDNELARVEKDPLLNRLMSQVFFNDRQESTIEFLQGSTLNTMGHFSEGFTLGAVLAGLFHAQKIMNSEKENGQLIPGQIIAGRGKDGHFYKIVYTKNGKGSFWDGNAKNPNNESLQILRSKHKGFFGFFRGYEAVADINNPANTKYESKILDLTFKNGENLADYYADNYIKELKITQYLTDTNGKTIEVNRTFEVKTDRIPGKHVFEEVKNKSDFHQGAKSLGGKCLDVLDATVGKVIGAFDGSAVKDVGTKPVVVSTMANRNAPPITKDKRLNQLGKNVFDSIEDILHYLPEKFRFDPHEVMSMKKKDKLSKFLKYLPPVKNLINWGIWGGVAAVAFGTITEGYHAGMRLPSITLGGGGGSPPASAPPEGHSPSASKENPSPQESAPSASNSSKD
jgi:hypothetical protein